MNQVLKLAEVAAVLRASAPVAAHLIRDGHLPAVRVGRQWRINATAVDELLRGEGNSECGGEPGKSEESREAA